MSKRRSIRNKMKSLKINYLQGGNSCGLCFLQIAQKRGETRKFRPLMKKLYLLIVYSTINFCVCIEAPSITLM